MHDADELRVLRSTLAGGRWQVLPITEAISTRAMTYVEEHFLSGSLQLADALIAATMHRAWRTPGDWEPQALPDDRRAVHSAVPDRQFLTIRKRFRIIRLAVF